jgi:hypothetical protein
MPMRPPPAKVVSLACERSDQLVPLVEVHTCSVEPWARKTIQPLPRFPLPPPIPWKLPSQSLRRMNQP